MKANPTISLLSRLCNFRLSGVLSNPWDSIGMLNVNEGNVPIDNNLKILQLQSILQIQMRGSDLRLSEATWDLRSSNARLNAQTQGLCFCSKMREPRSCRYRRRGSDPHFTEATRDPCSSNALSTPKHEVRVLAPKHEAYVQSVLGCDSRVPTDQCEGYVLK